MNRTNFFLLIGSLLLAACAAPATSERGPLPIIPGSPPDIGSGPALNGCRIFHADFPNR
ncbi:hypothetical protein GW781_03495 [bacterium]|nr:hypothetical protein [bacterium]NCT20198.1 hypothetical protein [bacterium]